jgi:hypothetical protein
MGAGISADNEGDVYAATGDGRINDPSNDDGQSYVKIVGVPWTGALKAKFQHPDPNNFLVANELEGSSGPIVLPGINGVERILGATKMGLLTIMDASTMLPVQGPFRGAWNHYGPILGNPDALLIEQDAISCVSSNGCNASGIPSFNGQQNCCPQNCTCPSAGCSTGQYSACFQLIHGSHPHIHGQPCYFRNSTGVETVYWWGEKDYPRYMRWKSEQGLVVPLPVGFRQACSIYSDLPFRTHPVPGSRETVRLCVVYSQWRWPLPQSPLSPRMWSI